MVEQTHTHSIRSEPEKPKCGADVKVWQKVKLEDDSERWKFAFNILFCSFALSFVSMSYNSSRTIWMVGIFCGYSLLVLYARLGLRKFVWNIIMIIFGITSY
ncbi:AGAP005444-PA [Anopheles gambiae str. PEST]|uniref:AGAP005444-PA n=1 Tax=Anopheles gambiae TaxID=7165 RepID=A0NEC7_ANOGA|nr:AGAP005444-PA [Anopheles gambiae str. PEST]